MEFDTLDAVTALQALPESDPIEMDGVQLGGGACANTCQAACVVLTVNLIQTICLINATC
jgi:hypothetical protein